MSPWFLSPCGCSSSFCLWFYFSHSLLCVGLYQTVSWYGFLLLQYFLFHVNPIYPVLLTLVDSWCIENLSLYLFLLDLLEIFILFDHSGGSTVKILARNHQYLGVNQAVEMYRHREAMKGKLGVFWHTQGSGKSYSMVFLAQKIRRIFAGSPTIVVLELHSSS